MPLALSDPSTGWSFTCLTDPTNTRPQPGGIALRDVRHDQHNFARDIRVIGVRLKIQLVTPPDTVASTAWRFLPLSDPPFTVSPIQTLVPSVPFSITVGHAFRYLREADEALQFRTYFQDSSGNYVGGGVRADFTLPATYFSADFPNCEVNGLTISERFIFSRYALNPPHEPGGVLQAARCHPLVRFEFQLDPAVDRTRSYYRIESIRVDYRLHLYIDRHEDVARNSGLPQLGNQAGLFRDEETAITPSAIGAPFSGTATSRVAFAAVEKPLVFEVATRGLYEGASVIGPRSIYSSTSSARTWDNLHWWGARGTGQPIISAPGAFHAAHIHWRWGGAGSAIRRTIPEIDTGGAPVGVQNHPWGRATRTLVDPDIWMQTIRVAVVKNDPALDPSPPHNTQLANLSRDDWGTLFTSRGRPTDISTGDDIVLWYSAEVHRRVDFPGVYSFAIFPQQLRPAATYYSRRAGTVFLHGIFFAHNPEVGGFGVGTRDPQYLPRSESTIRASPTWERLP